MSNHADTLEDVLSLMEVLLVQFYIRSEDDI
jgi:hypothetical protein